MDIEQVRTFLALAKTLNFSKAATDLNISQPTVSRIVKGLETKLGGPLVRREREQSHLTELGKLVLPYFEQICENAGSMEEVARKYNSLERTPVSVGVLCTIGPNRLLNLVKKIQELFTGVEISIINGSSKKLQYMLENGIIDLAICGQPNGFDEKFHVIPLYTEPVKIVVNAAHPFAQQETVDILSLTGQPFIERTECEFVIREKDYLAEHGINLRRVFSSDRDDWVQAMVKNGMGISLLGESSIVVDGLTTISVPKLPFSRQIKVVTVRGRRHSAGIGAVLQASREAFEPLREKI